MSKYSKWTFNISTFSNQMPLWFENKPSGKPGGDRGRFLKKLCSSKARRKLCSSFAQDVKNASVSERPSLG
jgi:hypothetical protein